MKAWMLACVALAGAAITVQGGFNARLRTVIGAPWLAGAWIIGTEAAGFFLGAIIARETLPGWTTLRRAPWWSYTGGILGVLIVYVGIILATKLGAGPFNGILVTAAILTSLLLDHYGLAGFAQHSLNLWRVAGGLLMIGGVTLITTH